MAHSTYRRIVLARRPVGEPVAADFAIESVPVPDPGEGQVLIRHSHLGLAPAARIRMSADSHYAAPTALGAPIYGQALGEVIASRNAAFGIGDAVVAMDGGWQEFSLSDGTALTKLPAAAARPTLYLGLLGSSGFTAFVGLFDIGLAKAGDIVLVSAAAGAVGSTVIQMARLAGCHVIGVASGADKCRHVVGTLGAHGCIDREAADFAAALENACPDGIDLYFDNSGGAVRDAAWPLLRDFARVAVCGQIASYNATEAGVGPDWMRLLTHRLTVRGFLLRDHLHRFQAFEAAVCGWLADGRIDSCEHVWTGLEATPQAFASMLGGHHPGKTIVRLDI